MDVYAGVVEGEVAGFSTQFQYVFLGLVVVDPRNERARGNILILAWDINSVRNNHRRREGGCTEYFFQQYLHKCGWLFGFSFLGYAGNANVVSP